MPKPEKISLMGHAIELTKLARGPVPQMPPVTIDDGSTNPANKGNVILSAQQEMENRTCWAIATEFYDALSRAENDETVWHDPLDEANILAAQKASPAAAVAQAAQVVASVAPVVAAGVAATNPGAAQTAMIVSNAASALSSALSKPLGS